jgi:uncharacterized protein (DUF488 family)
MTRSIYTLGSSTRSLDEFLALLRRWDIALLADIRSFPTSRFEHFRRAALEKVLSTEAIAYVWLGRGLGGYRAGGYEKYMLTKEFAGGLDELDALAGERTTAVMCSERLPWRCHRRFVGRALEARGWKVVHVIEDDRTWETKETS